MYLGLNDVLKCMFIKRILIGYFHICGEYKERGYKVIASYLCNRINVARISIINNKLFNIFNIFEEKC